MQQNTELWKYLALRVGISLALLTKLEDQLKKKGGNNRFWILKKKTIME